MSRPFSSSFASRTSCSTARSFARPIGPSIPPIRFPEPTSTFSLELPPRSDDAREPIRGAPRTGSLPACRPRRLDARVACIFGLSDAAIALAYGINMSFGATPTMSRRCCCCFAARFRKRSARAQREQIGYTVERGVQRVPDAMASACGAQLRSVAPSSRAARARRRVGAARTVRRSRQTGDRSIPFGVLRKLTIDPPLTGAQARGRALSSARSRSRRFISRATAVLGSTTAMRQASSPTRWRAWSPPRAAATIRGSDELDRLDHRQAARSLDGLAAVEVGRRVIPDIERHQAGRAGPARAARASFLGCRPVRRGCVGLFSARPD